MEFGSGSAVRLAIVQLGMTPVGQQDFVDSASRLIVDRGRQSSATSQPFTHEGVVAALGFCRTVAAKVVILATETDDGLAVGMSCRLWDVEGGSGLQNVGHSATSKNPQYSTENPCFPGRTS